MMAEFKAEEYLSGTVEWEEFDDLNKPALMALAEYLNIRYRKSQWKEEIKKAVVEELRRQGYVAGRVWEEFLGIQADSEVEKERIASQERLEIERLKSQQALQEKEIELRQKEMELRQKEIDSREREKQK